MQYLSVSAMANEIKISRSRFYQLVGLEVFPKPIKQAGGMPFYDEKLQWRIRDIVSSGVGTTKGGKKIVFYNTKTKTD